MAQLIKLQDYISRYEWDIYRYPTQYIRQKNDQWELLYQRWQQPEMEKTKEDEALETHKEGILQKWKKRIKRKDIYVESIESVNNETDVEYDSLPSSETELKQYFLDRLFDIQMKWATSTVSRVSVVDSKFYHDELLRFLLQRFPDTYFIMYMPVFEIKQAPVESDILLISPLEIEIIHFLEVDDEAVIMAGEERTWTVTRGEDNERVINPLISLKRSEKWIQGILRLHNMEVPVKKTVVSRTNRILYATAPYQTKVVDRLAFEGWLNEKRNLSSPLKKTQLHVTECLLKQSISNSIRRPEWETENKES
ncbi:NERD domain-containing protein [Oceanobacillus sp. 1P07AA]|uniref:NERD domain-containing protein n=1 Tax=Oceanobacillus sp. 1P07AA TaxID=3132293 RepID=UPI0039A49B1F